MLLARTDGSAPGAAPLMGTARALRPPTRSTSASQQRQAARPRALTTLLFSVVTLLACLLPSPAGAAATLPTSPTAFNASSALLACAAPGGHLRSGSLRAGTLSAPGTLQNISCTFTIGSPGARTALSNVTADGEPVGLSLSIYDGESADPSTLIVRFEGWSASRGWPSGGYATRRIPPFFPLDSGRELVSQTGVFLLVYRSVWYGWPAYQGFIDGSGLSARFTVDPPLALQLAPPHPPPHQLPPPPAPPPATTGGASVGAGRTASVVSAQELLVAARDLSVASIVLSGPITLNGTELFFSGPDRVVVIRSDVAKCNGRCTVDAQGRSRLLTVSNGARVLLRGVEVARCAARHGGCVVVSGPGASFTAEQCVFRGAIAEGDGGALLALAGAGITVSGCSFIDCASLAGSGGGAAALFGSSVSADGSVFQNCSAQWGGALSGLNVSRVAVSNSSLRNCSAWYGGGAAVRWGSVLSAHNTSVSRCTGIANGGAMIASHFSSADITDTTMADCAAARGAGASALFFSSIRLDTADMQRMAAEFDGGCAFVRLMSNASISRLNCVQGTALAATGAGYGSGGAFSAYASPNTTISDSSFLRCSSLTSGGLQAVWSTMALLRVVVSGCVSTLGGGGGLEAAGSQTDLFFFPYCTRGRAGCDSNSVSIIDCVFSNNTALGGDGGGFRSSGVDVLVSNTTFKSNKAGRGGAIAMTSRFVLNGPSARSRAVLDRITLIDNSASRCGAVSMGDEMLADVVISNVQATGNAALAGEGGVFCYARKAARYTASFGKTLLLRESAGDVSLVDVGAPVPISTPFTASWHIQAQPGCFVVFEIADYIPYYLDANLEQHMTIVDQFTGDLLWEIRERPEGWTPPPPFVSADRSGLLITYNWIGVYTGVPSSKFVTGFLASWSNVCPLLHGAAEPPLAPAPPPPHSPSGAGGGASGESGGSNVSSAPAPAPPPPGVAGGPSQPPPWWRAPGVVLVSSGDASLSVNGLVASRNRALTGGVLAVDVDSGYGRTRGVTVRVSAASLTSNSAGASAGGIAIQGGATFSLRNATFLRNTAAAGPGGAILFTSARSGALDSVSFTECAALSAAGSGGAVAASSTPVSVTNCRFGRNHAAGDGGAVLSSESPSLTLSGASFSENSAEGPESRGGAVALLNTPRLSADSCEFTGNSVSVPTLGQSLLTWDGNPGSDGYDGQDSGADVIRRFRSGDGGALFISASTAESPPAAFNAAAVSSAGRSSARLSSCRFSQNHARDSGGAVSAWGSVDVSVQSALIELNYAERNGGGLAGGRGAALSLTDTTVASCSAGASSLAALRALAAQEAQAPAETPAASAPIASAAGLSAGPSTLRTVCGSVGGSAEAADGGAIWLGSGVVSAVLQNCSLSSNSAAGHGGAAAVSASASLRASSTRIANNSAELGGGAIALWGSAQLSLSGDPRSTVVNNSAQGAGGFLAFLGGAHSSIAGSVSLRGLLVSGNEAASGTLFAVMDAAEAFEEPVCTGCIVDVAPGESYGDRVSSPPARMGVSAPSGPVRAGSPFVISAYLLDAFGQKISRQKSELAAVECVSENGPDGQRLPLCDPSALRGALVIVYRDGGANFSSLLMYGAPGSTFQLEVVIEGIESDPIAVSVAACNDLEAYDPDLRQCACIANAARSNATAAASAAASTCRCLPGFAFVSAPPPPPETGGRERRPPPPQRLGALAPAAAERGSGGGGGSGQCVAAAVSADTLRSTWWVPVVAAIVPSTVALACFCAIFAACRAGIGHFRSSPEDSFGTIIDPEELSLVLRDLGYSEDGTNLSGVGSADMSADPLSADPFHREEFTAADLLRELAEVELRSTRVTCRLLERVRGPSAAAAAAAAAMQAGALTQRSGRAAGTPGRKGLSSGSTRGGGFGGALVPGGRSEVASSLWGGSSGGSLSQLAQNAAGGGGGGDGGGEGSRRATADYAAGGSYRGGDASFHSLSGTPRAVASAVARPVSFSPGLISMAVVGGPRVAGSGLQQAPTESIRAEKIVSTAEGEPAASSRSLVAGVTAPAALGAAAETLDRSSSSSGGFGGGGTGSGAALSQGLKYQRQSLPPPVSPAAAAAAAAVAGGLISASRASAPFTGSPHAEATGGSNRVMRQRSGGGIGGVDFAAAAALPPPSPVTRIGRERSWDTAGANSSFRGELGPSPLGIRQTSSTSDPWAAYGPFGGPSKRPSQKGPRPTDDDECSGSSDDDAVLHVDEISGFGLGLGLGLEALGEEREGSSMGGDHRAASGGGGGGFAGAGSLLSGPAFATAKSLGGSGGGGSGATPPHSPSKYGGSQFGGNSKRPSQKAPTVVAVDWRRTNLKLLTELRHPCIVSTYGGCVVPPGTPIIVSEWMAGGSLYDALFLQSLPLERGLVAQMARDVAMGTRFLHAGKKPVVARLSSKRIFLTSTLQAKIFIPAEEYSSASGGGGASADTAGMYTEPSINDGIATPGSTHTTLDVWTDPSVIEGGPLTTASDVFAFGIILFELFARERPYAHLLKFKAKQTSRVQALKDILRAIARSDLRPSFPESVPSWVSDLAADCWIRNPMRRVAFSEIVPELSSKSAEMTSLDSAAAAAGVAAGDGQSAEMRLLEDVLPAHVVQALKEGRKVEPESFPEVTIFFSDIVGFTDISAQLKPEEVMRMLDRLYTKLDALSLRFGLFKVETIGDAFMCCGGLPKAQPDHALRVAKFALEAVRAANSVQVDPSNPAMGCVNIRVGFHSGPVIASVVGTVRPRYCLFGDTVNTASRMESNSERNKVNMSPAARAALAHQAPEVRTVSRGAMTIKGTLECHFLDDSEEARLVCLAAQCEERAHRRMSVWAGGHGAGGGHHGAARSGDGGVASGGGLLLASVPPPVRRASIVVRPRGAGSRDAGQSANPSASSGAFRMMDV